MCWGKDSDKPKHDADNQHDVNQVTSTMSFALSKWLGIDAPQTAKDPVSLTVQSQSTQGQRSDDNQDAYLTLAQERLFALADGMGGHAGGRLASRLALDTLYQCITEARQALDSDVISDAIRHGHQRIGHHAVSHPELRGMGTTLVLVWLERSCLHPKSTSSGRLPHSLRAHCFHVGDSRVYRWRDYRLAQLTADHVSTLPGKASKPALARALGGPGAIKIDYQVHDWHSGDSILLCSDGISDALPDYRISNILAAGTGANERLARQGKTGAVCQSIARQLIEQAELAGGTDDKTVVWIEHRPPEGGDDL